MLTITVSRPEEPRWRRTFVTNNITFGHHPDNALVLEADSVDAYHGRVVLYEGTVALYALKSAGPLYVDGERLAEVKVLEPHHEIGVGAYTLRAFASAPEYVGAYRTRSPLERELLAAIAAGDEASRLVYADWLEGAGDPARAELLRLQHALDAMSPDAPTFERASDRLRELASGIDAAWRARVGKRPIEGCPAFDFSCPKQWSELAPTERDGVRHCSACDQRVYYCASVEEARDHASRGACVALDVTTTRWDRDLDGPYNVHVCDVCQTDAGPGLDQCPRCGGELATRRVVRGRLVVR
jgi:uncharacterized protein (TIGR02996 family)